MSPPIALSPVAEAIISTAPPDVMPEPLRSVTLPPDSALLEPAEISTEPPAPDEYDSPAPTLTEPPSPIRWIQLEA